MITPAAMSQPRVRLPGLDRTRIMVRLSRMGFSRGRYRSGRRRSAEPAALAGDVAVASRFFGLLFLPCVVYFAQCRLNRNLPATVLAAIPASAGT
jgi:hypothetical protein